MRLLLILVGFLSFSVASAAETGNCGTIVTPANDDITSLNPLLATSDTNSQAAALMYLGLIWLGANGIDWSR
jgi:ABC-type transport system substrate-binding protein